MVLLAALALPAAAADPGQFPDLSGYTAADAQQYHNYGTYPTTAGVQFTTPDGYRCRISYTGKANVTRAVCWGSLPGTSDNAVNVTLGSSFGSAAFANVDPATMDSHQDMRGGQLVDLTYSAADYKSLPAGSKVTSPDAPDGVSATCGVNVGMTACVIETSSDKHGFVLSSQGSWTF